MSMTLGWGQVLLRLGLAMVAGAIIGINRGRHGRAAGLRTTLVVCTAAALAMVLANYIIIDSNRINATTAWRIDPMRLPLGVLSGIGFIGAGVILRRKTLIRGVTTAATIWYVTVLGLCFGAGYLLLGIIAAGIACVALFLLPWPESRISQDRYGRVVVVTRPEGISEEELRRKLIAAGLQVTGLAIRHQVSEKLKRICIDVEYQERQMFELPPQLLSDLAHRPGVVAVSWR
jgi:putative Mg2+ transporter-C (MgtC) family protein